MSVKLKPGHPEDDIQTLADLIWTVDVPLMDYLFQGKSNWDQMFAADWLANDGCVSHSFATTAVEDGKILGVIISHESLEIDARYDASLKRWKSDASAGIGGHLDEAFEELHHLLPEPPSDSYYILDIAVDASAQGKGIGRMLMNDAVAQAKKLGKSTVRLDMKGDNQAIGFYKSLGFAIVKETYIPSLERDHRIGPHLQFELRL